MQKLIWIGAFCMLFTFASLEIEAQPKERADVAEQDQWNLTGIYATKADWQKDKEQISKKLDEIAQFAGILAKDADTLYKGLSLYFDIIQAYQKFTSYSTFLKDQDLRVSETQAMGQEASNLGNLLAEKTAFIAPELAQVNETVIRQYIQDKPELQPFRMFLENIIRTKAHTLSDAEERIMALTGIIQQNAYDIFKIFANAEFQYPEITISNGQKIQLTSAIFGKSRSLPNRQDREKVFQTFFESLAKFQNTFGANLVAELRNHYFVVKARKYNSCLEAQLYSEKIPVEVYHTLIQQVNKSLPTLHKFLELKKKALGVDQLHYYDLYVPITPKLHLAYQIPDAQKIVLDSLNPMGEECQNMLMSAFANRWIDYMPTKGKRSGAYCNGSIYDMHPFILMNWTDEYSSISTLTHELGHALHSYLANKAQPFATAGYSIFIAEIASTFNENLLNQYLIDHAANDQEKLFLLGSYLENLRTTIFRQTLFAEFELQVHEKIEKGEPLTGESMSAIYLDIVRKYYGHDQGLCIVEPYIAYEWMYVPHFYYNFYVYQYSTSLIYSTAIAQKVFDKDPTIMAKYLGLLKSGGSDYPIELIQKSGILDPLSSEPFELTMKRMTQVMEQIEQQMFSEKK